MSESLVTVVRYEEYGNTGLLKTLTLAFEMGDTYLWFEDIGNSIDGIAQKIHRIIKKINFCYHDGITLEYDYDTTSIDNTTCEVLLTLKYNYEKNPNFYKLDVHGLLPSIPKYDKEHFKYALIYGFEPTLNLVKLVNI